MGADLVTTEQSFYLTCVLMFGIGLVTLTIATVLLRWFDNRAVTFLFLLGCCMTLMGPFMALIGPSS